MAYYVRFLTPAERVLPITQLEESLRQEKIPATLRLEAGEPANWDQLTLRHPDGSVISLIERNPVTPNSLGAQEIAEFRDQIAGCKPASAVEWLGQYFSDIKAVYAFQVLSGAEAGRGWDAIDAVKSALWASLGGILQADDEGFSNEAGYHVLWQFAEDVSGTWWMGVLQRGKWHHFQMDLANRRHRETFFHGAVPEGVKLAP